MNTENLEKAVIVGAKFIDVVGEILEDGRVNLGDLKQAFALMDAVRGVTKIDIKALIPEGKDIDPAEKAKLYEVFKGNLELKSDQFEAVIEEGLSFILSTVSLLKVIQDLRGRLKS